MKKGASVNAGLVSRGIIFRRAVWTAAAALGLGCSLVGRAIPDSFRRQADADVNAFLPASKTPFQPIETTETRTPAVFPEAIRRLQTDPPAVTLQITIAPSSTTTSTLTVTMTLTVVPPTAVPAYLSPTITKTKLPKPPPTATPTSAPHVDIEFTATATPLPTDTATPLPTDTPTATEDPRSPTPTATLSGSETATFTQTATPTPTITPTQTPTPTVTKTPPPSATPTAGPTAAGCATFNFDWEAEVAVMINEQRAQYGKYALVLDQRLTNSARAHSVDMVVHKFMSHTGSDGSSVQEREQRAGYYGRYWGEIIGGGTPTIAVTWWMNEPGHRDMVLGTNWPYVDFGVGYAYCPGQGWFTVDFGAP
jgi:uncharacterized protein YkwD